MKSDRGFYRGTMRPGFVYFVLSASGDQVKIGFSSAVETRFRALRTLYGGGIRLLGSIGATMHDETVLHRKFAPYRVKDEWFRFDGECREYIAAAIGRCGA